MYSAEQLLNIAFGIRSVYHPEFTKGGNDYSNYETGLSKETITSGRMIQNGQHIMFPMKFIGGSYMRYDKDSRIIKERIPDFDLPASSIASFQQAKIETRTMVSGGGTVKEMYGLDDWVITIRGICMNDKAHSGYEKAIEQYGQLVKFGQLMDSIEVSGDLFDLKNIYRLVIIDVNFPELVGMPDVFPFELRCRSDKPIELIL